MNAYNGKILKINLTDNKIEIVELQEDIYKKFIGGSGLASKLFIDEFDFKSDALSENNILIITTSPLTGTHLPGCATRFSICAKSPLTDIWAETSCGGSFGYHLKHTGYDGIIIKGAASEPVYITIIDDKVEIKSAQHLWGKDTYEVTDILKKEAQTSISIGQAGENKVLFANIANEKGNYSGRCGLGAVMGSKNLKAIAVKGTKKIEFANEEKIKELQKELVNKSKDNIAIQALNSFGSDSAMTLGMMLGDVPIKNWSVGEWADGEKSLNGMTMADTILTKKKACLACPVACKREVKVEEEKYKVEVGPGPEYETCASFGTLLYINNLNAVAKANEVANRYGLDTVSCGNIIAFAIDCYEHGLLKKEDTDGLELKFGDPDLLIELIHRIAKREGKLGNLLADGSNKAAQRIGSNASDFAVCVKGLEAPMHDPRAFHGMGLAYAVSNRGACHLNSSQMFVEQGFCFYPELGAGGPYEAKESKGKAQLNVTTQNIGSIFNSACICMFAGIPFSAPDILNMLNYTTGFNYTYDELMKTGARIWYLKRAINNLFGITRKDDTLPKKILTPVSEGGAAFSIPDIELMLNEFYPLRGLDEEGKVIKAKLIELDLEEVARRF